MTEPIEVPVGACRCEGTPHSEDIVYLAPELSMSGGLAVEAAMSSATTAEGQTLAVSLALVHHNIVGWTFVDGNGLSVPVTPGNVDRLLPYARGGELVANKAAGLYLEDAVAPLAQRLRPRSQPSRTNGQTRPILASHAPSRRRRSASSSPAASGGKR